MAVWASQCLSHLGGRLPQLSEKWTVMCSPRSSLLARLTGGRGWEGLWESRPFHFRKETWGLCPWRSLGLSVKPGNRMARGSHAEGEGGTRVRRGRPSTVSSLSFWLQGPPCPPLGSCYRQLALIIPTDQSQSSVPTAVVPEPTGPVPAGAEEMASSPSRGHWPRPWQTLPVLCLLNAHTNEARHL